MRACQVLRVINQNRGLPAAHTFLLHAEETVATQVREDTYVKQINQKRRLGKLGVMSLTEPQ